MTTQVLLVTLAMGCIYGTVALGFTLIWNAISRVNFAQGDLVMIGAFLGVTTLTMLRLPLGVAWIVAIAGAAVIGLIFERLVIRPVNRAEFWASVTTTLGASIVMGNVARLIWGPAPLGFPSFFPTTPVTYGAMRFIPNSLWVIAVALLLVVLQDQFFRRTIIGKAMKAVAIDRPTAELMGIDADRMVAITMSLSSILAAVAGLLLAPTFSVTYDMGLSLTLKAFAATIIGGFGSVRGAVVGGLLIAILETLVALFISTDYRDIVVFTAVIVVLLVSPRGVLPTAQS